MQTVNWLGFGMNNSITRSIVHIFPSSGGVSAPYQAMCQLSVFGPNMEAKSVLLEGVRLSQPDGVRIEDAFPGLKVEGPGFFGIHVTIGTNQPRVELYKSLCVIELVTQFSSVRYLPKFLSRPDKEAPEAPVVSYVKDAFNTTSLIAVNASQSIQNIDVMTPGSGANDDGAVLVAHKELGASAVVEVDVQSSPHLSKLTPKEMGWGLLRSSPIFVRDNLPQDLAVFAMYRETESKKPISVSAL